MKSANDLNDNYDWDKTKRYFNRKVSDASAQGMNEIAMYYVQDTIKGLDIGTIGRSEYANPVNWVIGKNPQLTYVTINDKDTDKTHKVKKFNIISTIDNFLFGDWNDY